MFSSCATYFVGLRSERYAGCFIQKSPCLAANGVEFRLAIFNILLRSDSQLETKFGFAWLRIRFSYAKSGGGKRRGNLILQRKALFTQIGFFFLAHRLDIGFGAMDKVVDGIGLLQNPGEMRVLCLQRVDCFELTGNSSPSVWGVFDILRFLSLFEQKLGKLL